MPRTSDLVKKTDCNIKATETEKKMDNVTDLAATTVLINKKVTVIEKKKKKCLVLVILLIPII